MKEDKVGKDIWEIYWRKNSSERYREIERFMAINKKLDILFKRILKTHLSRFWR